ncbi:hypothetical protein [Paenibacillus naphthalenovorans]|uniref:hypothetical protein n=1 Tax=Paenibacillus naphthalenovorans TaxID=162209 RepID=UPI003D291F31
MKFKIMIIAVVVLFIYVGFVVSFQLLPIIKGGVVAKHYLENLVKGDFTEASKYLVDENQKTIMKQELSALKEKGVSITSYKNVLIESDDGWITGKATITLSENKSNMDYSVFIIFGGSRLNPLVAHLESTEVDSNNLSKWLLIK